MPRNQQGFGHVILVLILLAATGITAYLALTQLTKIPKPTKVGETPQPGKITQENYETTLNPFGDPWAWKKNSNPSIPVMLSAPAHYLKYQDPDKFILESQAKYLAKSNAPFLYFDSYEPHVEGQNPKSIELITRIKQLNPNIKALGYFVQWEAPPGYDEVIKGADNGNSAFEAFFVHKKDLPATKENRLNGRPDHPEWGEFLMDITNPDYRAFVIPKIVASIRASKMDGLMNDMLFYNLTDRFNNPPRSLPDNLLPGQTKDAWPKAMIAFIQELKTAMGPELYLFGNVDDGDPKFMKNDLLAPGRLDGVFFEDPFNGRSNPNSIERINNLMDIVDSFGKKSIMIVTGSANGTTFNTSNNELEKATQRYFFANYLITLRSSNHVYLYYYPTSINSQFNSEAFFREWDLDIGPALSEAEKLGNGVWLRKFERAWVYWNPTQNDYQIKGSKELFNIDNGQELTGQLVPANSGAIFVTPDLLTEYNRPPN